MKRLVLTIMALLCVALIGCDKEPVKTDLPKIDEEIATPSEIEAPKEDIELVESEIPTEPETPTAAGEEVIILPEADENTKYITIDFPEEPYTEPNLVSRGV